MSGFVPGPGQLVWLEFYPQAGHEQAGRRPAIVLSNRDYNRKTGLALVCPITSKVKGYPFEVGVTLASVRGVILSDQVKSLDWRIRRAELIGRVTDEILREVLGKLTVILGEAGKKTQS